MRGCPIPGYEQAGDYEVEVYHLFPKKEKSKRYYEILDTSSEEIMA